VLALAAEMEQERTEPCSTDRIRTFSCGSDKVC
jgi:hypothetical protein